MKEREGEIANALPVEIYFPFPALSHLFLVFHSNKRRSMTNNRLSTKFDCSTYEQKKCSPALTLPRWTMWPLFAPRSPSGATIPPLELNIQNFKTIVAFIMTSSCPPKVRTSLDPDIDNGKKEGAYKLLSRRCETKGSLLYVWDVLLHVRVRGAGGGAGRTQRSHCL